MSATKFTPGPWHPKAAKHSTDGEIDWGVGADIDGQRYCIAEAFGRVAYTTKTPAEANARLIAAAPDLYEALRAVLDLDNRQTTSLLTSLPLEMISRIRAALAKAEGRT